MGHRVVQLARQSDPLLGLHLFEPAAPVVVLGARGHAEGHRGHQHGRPADQVSDPGPAHEERGGGGDQDDREPCQHLTPGSPPEQRVRQDQEVDQRVHVEGRLVGDDQADVHGGGHAEGHRHHRERARTPPQQRRRQPHRHQQAQPRKPEVIAQRDLQHGAHGDDADQHPVPPHPRRWRRGARFVQDGPQRVDHRPSLGKARPRQDRPKVWSAPGRKHECIPASTPMCRTPPLPDRGGTGRRARTPAAHRGGPRVRSTRTTGPVRRPPPLGRDRHVGGGLHRGGHVSGGVRSRARRPVRGARARLATRHRAPDAGRIRRHGSGRRRRPHAA